MCGIFACFRYKGDAASYRPRAIALSKRYVASSHPKQHLGLLGKNNRLRHRGPDWSGCIVSDDCILVHERLAIVGVDTGAQPLVNDDGSLILAVNGEIYNHKQLRKELKNQDAIFKTHSDCEVIMHLVSPVALP